MTMLAPKNDTVNVRDRLYLSLPDTREAAVKATLTRKATIGVALKFAQRFRTVIGEPVTGIDWTRREIDMLTKTVKGQMFLSPSGGVVYVMAPRTRVIDGVKRTVMSIVENLPVSDVLSFEVA